jgi:hypothetical protein
MAREGGPSTNLHPLLSDFLAAFRIGTTKLVDGPPARTMTIKMYLRRIRLP